MRQSRLQRLINLLLEFQDIGMCSADSLAERFDTNVRTIYRDIILLREAGIGIIGVPGVGYKLPPDFPHLRGDILTNEKLERPEWLLYLDKLR